ncbi:MAG: c-type cytochrome [Vicinamibacteria bacterium]
MLKKILLSLVVVLTIGASSFAAFAFLARPSMRRAPSMNAAATPERLARGQYLAQGCLDCHSKRDFKRYAGPVVPPFGVHGDCFDKGIGVPGVVCPPNSPHPTGLGDKTKENFIGLFRAFGAVEGEVPKGGQNTIMPWPVYNKLTDEDLGIIYDYLRTQEPIAHTVDKFPKTPRG